MTLPRLELCGAVTAVELAQKLKKTLTVSFDSINYWTDSEIVLSWLYGSTSLKTFVANRVSNIQRKTDTANWKYINTKDNPADIISRGANTSELINNKLWWTGPNFLSQPESEWPLVKPAFKRDESEEKIIKTILSISPQIENFVGRVNHRNSIQTWQRVVAYCIKFASPMQKDELLPISYLSVNHLKRAMTEIVKFCQRDAFAEDNRNILNGKPEKTMFKAMTPILDADGVLRVGGRLQSSELMFEQKHPAILPYHHEVTMLIMKQLHMDNMHAGPQALLALTRQKYWPIKGKILANFHVELWIC